MMLCECVCLPFTLSSHSLFLSNSLSCSQYRFVSPSLNNIIIIIKIKKKEKKTQIVRENWRGTNSIMQIISHFPLPLSFTPSLVCVCDSMCLFLDQVQTPAKIRGGPTARSAAAGGWARPWGAIIWSADASSASASVRESPSARRRRPDASRHPVAGPLSCLQSNAEGD